LLQAILIREVQPAPDIPDFICLHYIVMPPGRVGARGKEHNHSGTVGKSTVIAMSHPASYRAAIRRVAEHCVAPGMLQAVLAIESRALGVFLGGAGIQGEVKLIIQDIK